MEKANHWCSVCGKGYWACDTCTEIKSFTPWRSITDSIEHYKIHLLVTDYLNGNIKKEEAGKKLKDISYDLLELKEGVRDIIKEILSTTDMYRKNNYKK